MDIECQLIYMFEMVSVFRSRKYWDSRANPNNSWRKEYYILSRAFHVVLAGWLVVLLLVTDKWYNACNADRSHFFLRFSHIPLKLKLLFVDMWLSFWAYSLLFQNRVLFCNIFWPVTWVKEDKLHVCSNVSQGRHLHISRPDGTDQSSPP